MNTLEQYANMMQNQTLDMSIFSQQGHNLCPVDGKLTLQTYVDDCHAWWFPLVEDFKTIDVFYSKENMSGAVVCEVTYTGGFKLPFVQYTDLDDKGNILTLTSYWNVEKLRKAAELNPKLKILFPENR
jgi:hypothetical protein